MQSENIAAQQEGTKLSYIDALRGIAILGVIMVHTNQYGRPSLNIFNNGRFGVQLFFVASAFTLFLSFNSRLGKEKSPARNFFIRRFFRIAPMYYLVGIGYYLLQNGLGPRYWLGNETHITIWNILSNFFFVHGINPCWMNSLVPGGWSITVEMTFYAILPFLFSKIKNIDHAVNFFILSIFVSAVFAFLIKGIPFYDPNQHLWNEFLSIYFPTQLPIFAMGIILFFIVDNDKKHVRVKGGGLLALALMFLFQLMIGHGIFQPSVIYGVGFLILGVSLSRYRFVIFVNPIVAYIGRISFSMYLTHFAVLFWLTYFNFVDLAQNDLVNYFVRYFIVLLITILLSTLTYNIIEVPFQGIGRQIIKRLDRC